MLKINELQKTLSTKAFHIAVLLASKDQKEIDVPELLYKFKLKRKDWLVVSRELRKHEIIKYDHKNSRLIFLYS